MQSLPLAVTRPHYTHRNQTQPPNHEQRTNKHNQNRSAVSIQTLAVPRGRRNRQQEAMEQLEKIKELKEWLLQLLNQARENWEQQLAKRKEWVASMRKEHRLKLTAILEYIQALRKQAYEKYRHICDRTREQCCTDCGQRAVFFNQLVRSFLSTDLSNSEDISISKQNVPGDGLDVGNGVKRKGEPFERPSIELALKNMDKRSSRLTHRTSDSQVLAKDVSQDYSTQNQKGKSKKLFSKFKRSDKEGHSRNPSGDKRTEADIKLLLSEQREGGGEYRFNQSKREDAPELKYQMRLVRKSSNLPYNTDDFNRKNPPEAGRGIQDSLSRRDSKASLRQSVLRQTSKNSYQESEWGRSQFKAIDAEEAAVKGWGQQGRMGRFGIQRNSSLLGSELAGIERSLRKKKSTRGRNRYIRKNSNDSNDVDIDISSEEEDRQNGISQRQQEQLQELLQEKEFFFDNHYKKVSRYRRERMIYEFLKREILANEGIEELPEPDPQPQTQDHQNLQGTDASSVIDLSLSNYDPSLTASRPRQRKKKYSIMERKESLISKLALLNQDNSFESIRGKIEEMLEQREKGRQQNVVGAEGRSGVFAKSPVQKFLSQVLRITDLKKVVKEKFMREADWSPKMREMHQFYTYLQYSMEAFHSKLAKTAEHAWKELTYEGSQAEVALNGLILDPEMRDWEGLDLSALGEEHHREIECSMKYYGIDVKRMKKNNQINYQMAADRTLNPIFSIVGQRSMRNIQEVTECLFASPQFCL